MIQHRFTSLLLAMAALLCSAAVSAQTKGYVLYGAVPSGYENLTSNVTASAQGSVTKDSDSPLTFTGKGLSGSQYCNTGNHLRLDFKAEQQMSLTSEFALHIFIKKAETATGDVQICLCKGGWNANRIPWLIANSAISSSEYSEVVLKYADRNTSIGWNSFGDGNLIGTDVNFEAAEVVRICAANGEQFMIEKIYLEATYTPTPGPGPEPEPVAEKRYYFFRGGDLPTIDGVTMVDLREGAGTTMQLNNMAKGAATEYIAYTLNGSWFSFNQNLKTATDMSDVKQSTWTLKLKVRTNLNQNSFNLRLNNAGECWMISSGNLPLTHNGEWEEITLPLSTSSKSLNFTSSMSGTIFQMHANGSANGNILDIAYAYLTNDPSSDETPADDSDTEAPTGLSITETAKTHNSITVTVSATDDQSPITYTFYNGETEVGNTTANSGVAKEYTITGLSPETAYTIGVKAKDLNDNETTKATVDITTNAAPGPVRHYIYGGDSPIDCTITYGNSAHQYTPISDYLTVQCPNAGWTAVTFTPKADIPNDIDDNYYVVIRFRSCMSNVSVFGFNNFRINLVNNGANFYLNSGEWNPYGDNAWHTVKFRLGDAAGTKPAAYLKGGQIAVQLHANAGVVAGDYIDVEYIYFTNDVSTLDPGVQTRKKLLLRQSQDNTSALIAANHTAVDVDFDRAFVNDGGQYTLCLPFSLDAAQAQTYFPGSYTRLESSELRGEMIHLNMVASSTIEAGVPYLYLPSENVSAQVIEDVTIVAADETETRVTTTYFGMAGIYAPKALNEIENCYVLGTDDYLYAVDPEDDSLMKAFRAYFVILEGAPAGAPARVVFNHQTATDMKNVNDNANVNKIVRDGRIYILRGEKVFTINGQLVK